MANTPSIDSIPTVRQMRGYVAQEFSADQLSALSAWLSLEALDRESAEIFKLAKAVELLSDQAQVREVI